MNRARAGGSRSRAAGSERILAPFEAAHAFGHPKEIVFEVDLFRCVSYMHFSFHQDGWHPYTACVSQFLAQQGIDYRDSVLAEYFEKFRPQTQAQAYFETCRAALPPLDQRSPYEALEPWFSSRRRFKNHHGQGNQNFGPVAEAFGRSEFRRLQRLHGSLRKYGYAPRKFAFIEGYLLRWDNDYRFHITNGFHRAAILSVLGYRTIEAKFNPKLPRLVDLDHIERWPQVENGALDVRLARRVFVRHFEENGSTKARNLGLIAGPIPALDSGVASA